MAFSPESDAALREIDRLLADGGVRHGVRHARQAGVRPEAQLPSKLAYVSFPRVEGRLGGKSARRSGLDVVRVSGWPGPGNAEPASAESGSARFAGSQLNWLVHGFSTRIGGLTKAYRPEAERGDLNLGFTSTDDPRTVVANRKLFLEAVIGGTEKFSLVTLDQIHSSLIRKVVKVHQYAPGEPILKGDGLMTANPGLLLGIQTADCLPVLLADKRNRAVAVFHAGWRGTLARIVENGVGRMRLEFGSMPQDMIAAIGPGIGQCCYAVGEEVRQQFESQFAYAPELFREVSRSDPIKERYPLLFLTARAPGHSDLGPSLHLDLAKANRRQLLAAGLKPAAIYLTRECTACHTERFFSYRRERGFTGRMMNVIGIRR